MLFRYFTDSGQHAKQGSVPENVQPGQAYRVPTKQDLSRPINVEIDFLDKKIKEEEQIEVFETDLYVISFSNYGGVISDLSFKKYLGKNKTPLKTISHRSFYEREETAFLLALGEKTPYFYEFVEAKELDDSFQITYKTNVDDVIIKKQFVVYKESYKIDLNIDIESKERKEEEIRARLFFGAPFIGEIDDETQNGFSIGLDGKTVNKIGASELDQAWIAPKIFGAEDKYFAHTLIEDNNNFTQRGFFKTVKDRLYTVLEGPEIIEKGSWNLSFYLGPKSVEDLAAVDQRLEDLLSFGWLSWICKLLLRLLAYIYSFFGNFGIAIIFLAVLLKIPFIPLSISGRKKLLEFQKYQPTITRIRTKYRSDIKKQQEEIVKFCKDHNISQAAPLMGCLPFLIQMPILFSLYRVLYGYLDLYQAPFFMWITDLSAKDPYYIFPLLMGATMFLQQQLTPATDSKQKVMMMFMPIIMTAVFLNFPSGLVLYWLTNNVVTIAETYVGNVFSKK
jgi:YidC/Oxa1 family membrane protein insertase